MDRLSELPDSLIFEILWWLPMRDVFRTSVLSKRWENLWTTLPSLCINDLEIKSDTDRVRKLVNRALLMWRGTKIQKFSICLATLDDKSLYGDIDLWVRFAKEHQVKELCLSLCYADDRIEEYGSDPLKQTQEEMYWVTQCLYSCRSLQMLFLEGCNLPIPIKNVEWDQLKMLTVGGYGLSDDLINRVLSGSPRLELLKLYALENHENLSIRSSNLTHLSVDKYLYFTEDIPAMDTELRIWTPNLRKLEISGVPYSKCWINHLPFLTYATLDFYGQGDYSHHLFSGNDFVGETLRQIFPTIQHARELVLSNWSIKGLGAMKNRNMLSPFPNASALKLEYCYEDHEEILHLLEIFPELEWLVLETKDSNKRKESVKLEANRPNLFLQELKIVRISWGECGEEEEDPMFPFIEILLKYACKLETMEFQVKETRPPSRSAFKKLLRMPRSSPTARLIFS